MHKNIFHITTVILFMVALFLPLLDSSFGISTTTLEENRVLVQQPEWSWKLEDIYEFPEEFETYYADNFGFRHSLIHSYSYFQFHTLGVSPSVDKVTIGIDDWLFYAPSISYTIPHEPATQHKYLEFIRWYFESNQAEMKALGLPYVIVIAPDKKDLYREFVPKHLQPRDGAPWNTEIITAYLKEHCSVPIIDLGEHLRANKGIGALYQKSDAHWNTLGAFLASEYICDEIRPYLPNLTPSIPLDACTIKVRDDKGGDLANMLGLSASINEFKLPTVTLPSPQKSQKTEDTALSLLGVKDPKINKLIAFEQANEALPRAVIFRDSFATSLLPYFNEHFSRSVYYWDFRLHDELIDIEKPDIVIHLFVGRQFAVFNNIRLNSLQKPEA